MSTWVGRPNSNVTLSQRNLADDGSSSYSYIDEETLSESDGCLAAGTEPKLDVYGLPNHTTESGTINSITVKGYFKQNTAGKDIRLVLKIGTTVYYSGAQTITTTTTLYSNQWSSNPAGGAWGSDWSVLDALMIGQEQTPESKNGSNCYQLWVEVDYTAAAGGSLPLKNVFNRPFRGVFR